MALAGGAALADVADAGSGLTAKGPAAGWAVCGLAERAFAAAGPAVTREGETRFSESVETAPIAESFARASPRRLT